MQRCVLICKFMSLFAIMLLCFSVPARGAIQLVQSNAGDNSGGSGGDYFLAFASGNAAGNLIIVSVSNLNSNLTSTSVSDSKLNTYVLATSNSNGGYQSQLYYAANIAGGANTIKVTSLSGWDNRTMVQIFEYSGVATSSPLDQATSNTGTGSSLSSGSVTTTQPNELIFGIAYAGSAAAQFSPGTGYTMEQNSTCSPCGPSYLGAEDAIVSATGTYTATFAETNSYHWVAQIATFKAASASSGILCGLPDDGQVHPPLNYTSFTPPAKGGTFVDPDFGCTVKRVSDVTNDFPGQVGVVHGYSLLSPFNANDTLLSLKLDPGADWYIADLNGGIVMPRGQIPCCANLQWDANSPYVFWITSGTQLLKETINYSPSCAAAHNCTLNTPVVWHDFSNDGYTAIINVGTGASPISLDGDHVALAGMKPDSAMGTGEGCEAWLNPNHTTPPSGPCFDYFFVWKLSTNTVDYQPSGSGTAVWHPAGLTGMHSFQITGKNSIKVNLASTNYNNDVIWDGTNTHQFMVSGTHTDFGLDMAGNDVAVISRDADTADPCPNHGGSDVQTSWWATMSYTCWFDTNWRDSHVSYQGGPNQPWAAWSAFHDPTYPNIYNIPPESDWQTVWPKWAGEVVIARVDANNDPTKVIRLAHHHSHPAYVSPSPGDSFWRQPHASISRTGKYIAFDSDMGNASIDADVYIIQIQ